MGVQMFVCMSVGMWRVYGNPNPNTDLDNILSMDFGAVLIPAPLTLWA